MTPTTPGENKYSRFSCPNPACSLFNQLAQGNITHRSWTGKNKDIERLRCTYCGKEFSERAGTLMAYTKLPEEKIIRLLKCQRWGVCDEGAADICDVDIKSVHRFHQVAHPRAEEHHHQVVQGVDVEGVQLDEAHSKLRPGKVDWIHTGLAMGSLFILAIGFGPRDTSTAPYLIAQVISCVRGIPLFLTDGWKAYPKALLQVVGRVYRPRRKGQRGRKPKPRLVAPDNLFYAQVVKQRDGRGRVVNVSRRVIFGGPRRFFKTLFHKGLGTTIQTSFMERWYGCLRGWVAPLRRRTRCLSWNLARHRGRIWLRVSLYNFVIPHKSLTQDRHKRTPAMAIGLTDHVWTYREYVWLAVHHDPILKQKRDEHIQTLLTPADHDAVIEIKPAKAPSKKTGQKRQKSCKQAA